MAEEADKALAEFRDSLTRLAELPELTAVEAETTVLEAQRRQTESGVDPSGKAWKPTLKGQPPLKNAAKAIGVASSGATVTMIVNEPEAFHHMGTTTHPRRQIIPDRGEALPGYLLDALKLAATRAFNKVMK